MCEVKTKNARNMGKHHQYIGRDGDQAANYFYASNYVFKPSLALSSNMLNDQRHNKFKFSYFLKIAM